MAELPNLPPCLATSRRTFLKQAGTIAVAGTLGVTLSACDTTDPMDPDENPNTPALSFNGTVLQIDLSQRPTLKSAGGFLLVTQVSGTEVRAVVVNVDGTNFKAFTSVCTHRACDVDSYNTTTQRLRCSCHGAQFSLTGDAVRGPAVVPLTEFAVNRNGDLLSVTVQ